jgi:hypothetical protein
LNEKEKSLLAGVFELAGKMYEGTHPPSSEKRKLSLTRETVRELHVWERLIETQGYSLWTCDRPNPFDQVILPLKK